MSKKTFIDVAEMPGKRAFLFRVNDEDHNDIERIPGVFTLRQATKKAREIAASTGETIYKGGKVVKP